MDIEQIENCINAILSENNEERAEATELLTSHSQNPDFSILLAKTITNDQVSSSHRLFCLTIFIRLNVIFPPDLFASFLPLFNNPDVRFSNLAATLLARNVKTEEQIATVLESSTNASLTYINGILNLFIEILLDRNINDIKVIQFCLNAISQTQNIPIDESETNLFMNVRGYAAKVIDLIAYRTIKENPDPDFVPLLNSLLSLPINDERNIPVFQNVITSSSKYLEENDFFNICLQQLQILGEMAPLTGKLIYIASLILDHLRSTYDYNYDTLEFDQSLLVSCIIQCSLLNTEVIERWKSNINEFLVEVIMPAEYDDTEIDSSYEDDSSSSSSDEFVDDAEYNFFYLREDCLYFAKKFNNEVIEICTQMMGTSPFHMETAFFYLSSIVPSNYPVEIDLDCPDDEDPILYGQYIYTSAALNLEIDGGRIDECIETDNDFLSLFIAKAIIESNNKVFIDRVVPITTKLLNMNYMFNLPECSVFLELIYQLIKKDKSAFVPLIESLVEILFKIFQTVCSYRLAATSIFTTLSIYNRIPETSNFIQESTFPLITELINSGDSYLIFLSFDLMAGLYCPLERSILPLENIESLFELFMKIIVDSISSLSTQTVKIDQESMDSIMPLLAFFARSFSPSPFAAPVCQLLTSVLTSVPQIKSNQLCCLPSCVIHSFLNCSDHDVKKELLKALFMRLTSETKSNSFRFSIALSISSLILTDRDETMKCINEIDVNIKDFLTLIPEILDNTIEIYYIDELILVATLFSFDDLLVVDNEVEKPLSLVAIRTFCAVFNHIFEKKDEFDENGLNTIVQECISDELTFFSRDDPYFRNHIFRSMKIQEYIKEVLPPYDQIPSDFRDNIQKILQL